MERELVSGGFYKHFKNKLYQVKNVCYHSETKEKMVIYQAMYGDFLLYVRPYNMFLSEVDHVKYPDVKQKYRFEEINPRDFFEGKDTKEEDIQEETQNTSYEDNNILDMFLDARDFQAKLDVITRFRNNITDEIIDVMAESLDIVVPESDISARIDSLRKCLIAHAKYEGDRLRQ